MAELQFNRWDRLIRKIGNIVGARSIATTILEDVFPMLDMENTPPELMILAGKKLAWGTHLRPLEVLEFSSVQLFNPADSGMVAVVTKVLISTQATAVALVNKNTPLTDSSGTRAFRDGRDVGTPVMQIRSESSLVVESGALITLVESNIAFDFDLQKSGLIVLTPGTGLQVQARTINFSLRANFMWYERVLESSELST